MSTTEKKQAAKEMWAEWQRLTRFANSARLAFARERALWESLEIENPGGVNVAAPAGQGRYRVTLSQHVSAVKDEETLAASVLVHSYALTQAVALTFLDVDKDTLGIETWGTRLLEANNESWDTVVGEKAGAVWVAIVRNAFAHGTREVNGRGEKRLRAVGVTDKPAGTPITLTFDELLEYRVRLRSLLNLGGVRAT